PKKKAHASSEVSECACDTSKHGTAVRRSRTVMSTRPPTRSVRIPSGRRQAEPLRMAMAVSHENWILVRCSSSLMGMPSTPNINQTANSKVNAVVESARTRLAPGCGGSADTEDGEVVSERALLLISSKVRIEYFRRG